MPSIESSSSSLPSAARPSSSSRRGPSAVQTAHFKAFWVKPVEVKEPVVGRAVIQSPKPDLVQTVIPKRLLKKAVDRNGLRRVLREAMREAVRRRGAVTRLEVSLENANLARVSGTVLRLPTARVVLTSARGFAEQPSRHALKGAWRTELDQLLSQLFLRLKV
jgi:RNase P protein component